MNGDYDSDFDKIMMMMEMIAFPCPAVAGQL